MISSNCRTLGGKLLSSVSSLFSQKHSKSLSPVLGMISTRYSFAKASLLDKYHSTRQTSIDVRGVTVKIMDVLNPDHKMLTYFIPPQLGPMSTSATYYTIPEHDACRMVFLEYKEDEQPQEAWEKRKAFSLSSKQISDLLSVQPNSNQRIEITNSDGVFTTHIAFSDHSKIQQMRIQAQSNQHDNANPTWQNRFNLSYVDYPLFAANLKSNLYHTSGLDLMLEISKEYQLEQSQKRVEQKKRKGRPPMMRETTKRSSSVG